MGKRKVVIFYSDDFMGKKVWEAPHIVKRLQEFDQYDADIRFVLDTSLESNDKPGVRGSHRIEREGPEWVKYNPEELEAIKDAEVLFVGFHGVSTKLLEAAKQLKLVNVMRSGVENINVPACTEHGVVVSCAPGRVSEPVADYAIAMIMAFNRYISQRDMAHSHAWPQNRPEFHPPLMREATIGLIGFGIIGKKVTQRLSGFGPRIIAYDPYANKEDAKALGVEILSMEEVMSQSDFVSVHARLLPATEGLIGEKEFSYMKPTAVFINTARAGLVDEAALVEVLKAKKIRGAALDVFSEEPLPSDHPLMKLDNVILTPHMAGGAGDTFTITVDIVKEELHRYFKGEKLLNRVN